MNILYEKPYNYFLQVNHNYSITYPMHQHYKLEIIYVRQGKLRMQYLTQDRKLNTIVLTPRTLFFIAPNVPHAYIKEEASADKENDFLIVTFSPDIEYKYSEVLLTNRIKNPIVTDEKIHPDVVDILERIGKPIIVEEKKAIVNAYLIIFLERLLDVFLLEEIENMSSKSDSVYIIDYVNTHFTDSDLNLKTISRNVGVSESNISRFFSINMNENLRGYINALRIDYAKKLLMNSGKNVTNIMFESGYSEPQSFNRIFKKQTGMTPSKFAKKFKNPLVYPDKYKDGILYYEQLSENEQCLYMSGGRKIKEAITQ